MDIKWYDIFVIFMVSLCVWLLTNWWCGIIFMFVMVIAFYFLDVKKILD